MPKTNFQYDESGNTFYYFLLTFLGIILFPSTYYFWPTEETVYIHKNVAKNVYDCLYQDPSESLEYCYLWCY